MSDSEDAKLVHCIYTSAATIRFDSDLILELLDRARSNNAKLDVTGMLLHDKGSFFQILEGDPKTISSLLAAIQNDTRHDRVVKIIYEEIEQRNFTDWTMGFSCISRQELNGIEGLNDFFQGANRFVDLDEGRAKVLLRAFKDGKWRSSLN